MLIIFQKRHMKHVNLLRKRNRYLNLLPVLEKFFGVVNT